MKPLIILGAPRSGTNILRDTLCSSKFFTTWDCDEINYIWRVGSALNNSDELDIKSLNKSKRKYIVNSFLKIWKGLALKNQNIYVVEKTCANCLRLAYVFEVFPKAKFIYIKRNPYDSIYSIKERWKGKTSNNYLLKKAKYIPKIDLPYYAIRYLNHRLKQKISLHKELPTWGPRFKNIDVFRKKNSLIETCAKQWSECTKKVENDIDILRSKGLQIFHLTYEDFVSHPEKCLAEINVFLGLHNKFNNFKVNTINNKSLGKGKNNLTELEKKLISKII